VSIEAPISIALSRAMSAEGLLVGVEGVSAWTDAALINGAGIPAVCFGPGDMGLAHADEEWVSLAEIEQATRVLTRLIEDWCR
jgi:acetylornithine deacetylase